MTERGRRHLHQSETSLTIGPSSLDWNGDVLTIRIDEVTAPLPSRIRGTVRLHPGAFTDHAIALDPEGHHGWWPMAPCARVEVNLARPALRWSGPGYLDTNWGDTPLEESFTSWDWSRAALRRGTAILYDARYPDGGGQLVAIRCDPKGLVEPFDPPPSVALPSTLWRVARGTRAEAGHAPGVRMTLEDAPFYARSVLSTRLLGQSVTAMHESLSLERFSAPWVQMMLPFRMPRAWR
jgi:carotenoid 1,2-hydratase